MNIGRAVGAHYVSLCHDTVRFEFLISRGTIFAVESFRSHKSELSNCFELAEYHRTSWAMSLAIDLVYIRFA